MSLPLHCKTQVPALCTSLIYKLQATNVDYRLPKAHTARLDGLCLPAARAHSPPVLLSLPDPPALNAQPAPISGSDPTASQATMQSCHPPTTLPMCPQPIEVVVQSGPWAKYAAWLGASLQAGGLNAGLNSESYRERLNIASKGWNSSSRMF